MRSKSLYCNLIATIKNAKKSSNLKRKSVYFLQALWDSL